MWAWLTDNPRKETDEAIADGWCGVYGLPRVLWLGEDDTLRLAPAPELQVLRYNERRCDDITLDDGAEVELPVANGRLCEIKLDIDLQSAQRTGLRVRTSAKNEETTLLYYDAPRFDFIVQFCWQEQMLSERLKKRDEAKRAIAATDTAGTGADSANTSTGADSGAVATPPRG